MISILKYNAGNTTSVSNAIQRLGYKCIVTDDPEWINNSDKLIIPGVGEASTAMQYLIQNNLDSLIRSYRKPVLGICLGLQLMCESSDEGSTECLGIFNTKVRLFPSKDIVPHIGWNNISNPNGRLFKNTFGEDLYFLHSYYAETCKHTIATCDYITEFSAALSKDNYYATQFHPEKSGVIGDQIFQNFLSL